MIKALSEIIQFRNGKKRPIETGMIPVYGGNGILDYANTANHENCIIIGRVGAYCGSVYRERKACWVSDNAIAAIPMDGNDYDFCYYLLQSLKLNSRHIGTSQPLLTQEILNRIEADIPAYPIQNRIGSVLSALDDKIAVNERINDNLAQQLQCAYMQKYGSPDQINGTLADICSYARDRIAVSTISRTDYFSTENMLPNKQGYIAASSLPTTEYTPKCEPGQILVSNIRPYFKKILLCREVGGCSADVLCFAAKHKLGSAYVYSTLYSDRFFDFMVAGSKGTKMPRGDKQQIMQYPVHVPTEEELGTFADLAKPILGLIASNNKENKALSELRDGLLPRLMSGEIDVSDIQI